MAETKLQGGVIEVSTLRFVQELCLHVFERSKNYPNSDLLLNAFQAPTKQAVWSVIDDSVVIGSLVRLFYDIVLLKRWEWYGVANRTFTMTPSCQCMSFSYHLLCQGMHDKAGRLVKAVTSLTGTRRTFREPEAILLFLSLLAQLKMDSTQAIPLQQKVLSVTEGELFQYKIYSSSFFEMPQEDGVACPDDVFSQSLSLLKCTPGTGFNSFLSQRPEADGDTAILCDGMVHSKVEDVNTSLGLPRLPIDYEDLTLMHHTEPVNLLSTRPSSEVPVENEVTLSLLPTFSSEISVVELFSLLSSDTATHSIREWEGWKTSSRQYLCDNAGTCLPHALELCLSGHCSLAGVDKCDVVVVVGELLVDGVINTLDTLPMNTISVFEEGGSVSWMFGTTIQSLLDYFRAQLHQLAGVSTELELSLSSHWILPTVRFLLAVWNDVKQSSKGLDLLDVLFVQASQVQGTPYYLLLLNLLVRSLAPYFKFVEQWVFQGWLDLGEEFGLHANVEALDKRDEEYWSRGYTLAGEDGCAPRFLSSQAHTILTCGKALNLLRICKPSHPLCTGMFCPPKLRVQLSRRGLEESNVQCQQYRREVQENEHVRHELLQQELLAKEDELRAGVLKARQEARAHAEKLRKVEEAYQAQERQKKITFRTELLEQIKSNQMLRSEQEAKEHQQDKERLDYLSSKEMLQTEREVALQVKAKEEMIAFYAELSKEAELRRLRAEWKAKRYELSVKRLEFLRKEKEMFSAESQRSAGALKLSSQIYKSSKTQLGRSSLPAVPISFDVSPTNESIVHSEHPGRRTWGENSSHEEKKTTEQASRKTWIASMIDQPAQIHVECGSQSVQLDGNGDKELVSTEVTFTHLTPTQQPVLTVRSPVYQPSVVQDLIYTDCGTADSAISSHLNQVTARPLSRDWGSIGQELSYSSEHVQSVEEQGKENSVSSRGCRDPSSVQDIIYGAQELLENRVCSRDSEPKSRAQDIFYSANWANGSSDPLIQEHGHPRLVSSRGHAPPSTAQFKMYPLRYTEQVKEEEVVVPDESEHADCPKIEFSSYMKYRDNFTFLGNFPSQDILSAVLGPSSEDHSSHDADTEFLSVYPLSVLIEQSLTLPILAQSTLVNEALLRYFLTECRIVHHFTVIKWFLLLEDGEFGHALSTRLCEELAYGSNWKLLCSASFLNLILTSALEASVHSHCPEAQRISFALKYCPTSINTHAINALEFLQLKYKVDWPCNIVLSSSAIEKYNKILQLLLQMKRASWALKNTFHQLKHCSSLSTMQTRQLQVYRHEYQHFVNVMHGYIANQLFQITWREFETDLQNEAHSFEDLLQAHHNFINKAIFRCLLSKKALPVMKLIHDIFSSILKFSNQLTGAIINSQKSYTTMCETHMRFREVSGLLIKVVDKLVQRGYQPHLEDFLLRLDFNDFYIQ